MVQSFEKRYAKTYIWRTTFTAATPVAYLAYWLRRLCVGDHCPGPIAYQQCQYRRFYGSISSNHLTTTAIYAEHFDISIIDY